MPLVVSLVSGSEFINHMYLTLLPPILGILAAEFDASLAALGVAIGVQAFVNTAFQLPFGYLADNYDRTLTLGICLLLGALGTFLVAIAPSYGWLLVGQAVLGLGIAAHHPAQYSLLSDATPERHRGRMFSVLGFAGNLGFAAPAAVIVAVTAVPGLTWRHAIALIGAVGLGYAILTVYVLLVHVPPEVRRPNRTESTAKRRTGVVEKVRREFSAIVRSPIILSIGALAMLLSIVMWGVASFVVTLLEQEYAVDPSTASLTLTMMFVAGAAYKLIGGDLTDRIGPIPVLVASAAISGVTVLLLSSLAVAPLIAVAVAVVGGNAVSLSNPARDKLTDLLSRRDDLGRNFAIITIGLMIGQTVSPPLFGFLIEVAGFRFAFASIAVVAASAFAIIGLLLSRWGDQLVVSGIGQAGD